MLKKVMAALASRYLAIKVRIRAVETHLIIQSLLLRDKKMIRHLFRQRKHFNLSNKIRDEDKEGDYPVNDSLVTTPLIHSSIATTPIGIVQVLEKAENKMEIDDYDDGGNYADSLNGDEGKENQSVSDEDIDKVADLFIQRFHHQIRMQKSLAEED